MILRQTESAWGLSAAIKWRLVVVIDECQILPSYIKAFIDQSEAGRHFTKTAAESSLVDLVCRKNPRLGSGI